MYEEPILTIVPQHGAKSVDPRGKYFWGVSPTLHQFRITCVLRGTVQELLQAFVWKLGARTELKAGIED